jgi:Flp pilus assembly protein TadD
MVVWCSAAAPVPQAAALHPAASAAPLQRARQLIDAGDFKQASAALRVLLDAQEGQEGSAAAHSMLAYCLLRLNDPKDSLAEYTRAAAIERPSAVNLQNVAKDYVLLNDLADADHWMTLAVQINGQDPEGWYGLGRVRYSRQRFQDAVDCFQKSLALAPRSVKAENNLGLAYEGLNRTEEAIAAYRLAIAWQKQEAHPSEQPLLNLGIVLLHQGKLSEAQMLLSQALAIAPRDPHIREQLGHVYLQLKQFAQSQQQFEAAVALEPQNPALHFMLGRVYQAEGQEAKAKAEFARSAALTAYHSTPVVD